MAGSWRVVVEAVRELDAPTYRVGDFARTLLHEDVKIRNAVVQVSLAGKGGAAVAQTTKPFDVDDSGCAKIDQVLFVQRPAKGQVVLVRVVKPHRVQKDALIGEAEVSKPSGKQRLQLLRGGKPRGYLTVSITDGIPAPPPQLPITPASAGSASSPVKPVVPPPVVGNRPSAASAASRPAAQAFMSTAESIATAAAGAANAAASSRAPVDIRGSVTSCFQGCLAGVEGLMTKGVQAAGEVAALQPIIAALGLGDQKGFLERKRAEPGIQRRPSGLLYRVKRNGTGRHHPAEDTPCDCHYRGRLTSGKEFDSSYRDGKPARFMPTQVIKGWSEALQLMVEGDMWELFIPPELAYGDRGVDGVIPGGAVLVFEVELVKVRGR